MARVSQGDDGHAVPRALLDPQSHGLLADGLAEAELSIDDGDGVVLEDNAYRLTGEHSPVPQPLDIGGHADDAVRIVAHQVRFYQVSGDALSFGSLAPCRVKDGGGEFAANDRNGAS